MGKRIISTFFVFIETTCAGVWVGALITFGFAVAGTVFRELPSITTAGTLTSQVLHKLHYIEGGAAALMGLAALYFLSQRSERTPLRVGKTVLLVIMIAVLIYYAGFLTDRMEYLRTVEIGDFDQIDAAKQVARNEFDRLHTLYTRLASVNLLLALGFLLLSAFERSSSRSSGLTLRL